MGLQNPLPGRTSKVNGRSTSDGTVGYTLIATERKMKWRWTVAKW